MRGRSASWCVVGVTRGLLHVAERDAGIQRGGDERVPQGVWSDSLVDPGATGDATHDPGCAVPVETLTVAGQQNRSLGASPTTRSIARAVRGASGTVTVLPPLRRTTKVR